MSTNAESTIINTENAHRFAAEAVAISRILSEQLSLGLPHAAAIASVLKLIDLAVRAYMDYKDKKLTVSQLFMVWSIVNNNFASAVTAWDQAFADFHKTPAGGDDKNPSPPTPSPFGGGDDTATAVTPDTSDNIAPLSQDTRVLSDVAVTVDNSKTEGEGA